LTIDRHVSTFFGSVIHFASAARRCFVVRIGQLELRVQPGTHDSAPGDAASGLVDVPAREQVDGPRRLRGLEDQPRLEVVAHRVHHLRRRQRLELLSIRVRR
jgi:hypothetical protein